MAIDVPADPRFLQVLRVASAAAGVDVLGDLQRVDDLRLAVDELAAAAIASADASARLQVEIWTSGTSIRVQGRVRGDGDAPVLSDIGRMLVDSVARSHRLAREHAEIVFELALDAGHPRT